ncbi:DUF1203 domain-containing protein [Thioclava sp. 'Guangxiensis']|uniref:DUF1203 domain-containing protein n=1 Tax=Thioclava sp. 'Guangxiensis' TaxID=3149044 RepID=UPI00387823B5
MPFQIHALPVEPFVELFQLTDEALAARRICRMRVTERDALPCRVSLEDARAGETVLLLNYEHQPAQTPYRASHAIFVREGVARAQPQVGEVPQALRHRLISIRPFDHGDMMLEPDLVSGADLHTALAGIFAGNDAVAYVHLHYAKAGCFAAQARPV